jgi:peptidoglycan hydrolase-like protein with peptidoglycan-binding domain
MNRDTWSTWQTQLQSAGHYVGRVDGRPGRMTYSAIQKAVGVKIDGAYGPMTRKAVQRHVDALGFDPGVIDGVLGKQSVTALQRSLNDGKWDV